MLVATSCGIVGVLLLNTPLLDNLLFNVFKIKGNVQLRLEQTKVHLTKSIWSPNVSKVGNSTT